MSKIIQLIRFTSDILIIALICSCFCSCVRDDEKSRDYGAVEQSSESHADSACAIVSEPEPVFISEEIPQNVRDKMYNVTISENSPMTYDELSYLTITFYGYDNKTHTGNMIVADEIANETLSIFRELYEAQFPIEKIKLACEYDGIDEYSMRDNNTSAYNDRPIEGSGAMSYHQLGLAIDINPLVNPYIRFSDGVVLPENAHKYLDRTLDEKGMILDGGICVEIFRKYGWTWGGDWNSLKDYQHFEKKKENN